VTTATPAPDVVHDVRGRLLATGAPPTMPAVREALASLGRLLGDDSVQTLVQILRSDLVGLGPLTALATDPGVTDILVNGVDEVWVDRGVGLERVDVRFVDTFGVGRLAQRLAAAAGRRLDQAVPFVDARLPDGVRLHAVLPPVSEQPLLSLRMPARRGFGLDDLVAAGSVSEQGADWLRAIIAARKSFLVTGGTGCGKTTVLGALLALVPDSQRIVVVEDTAELAPFHPHVLRLQARNANVEGAGVVTVRDLVKQALRMRPDRLVVGEVRGAEVVDLLAALNTGHEGGCGTVHANAPESLPARLEALATAAGMPREAVHSQVVAGVDVIVHVARRAGQRRISEVGIVQRGSNASAQVAPALYFEPTGVTAGPGYQALADALTTAA
jgi:pilus assembly protein CpaF